jgi:DNA-binding NarL/FixJ family response regulator
MKSRATAKGGMTRAQVLAKGREAFRTRAWGTAFSQLSAADQETPLAPEQVAELAQAALLIGREVEGAGLLTRAHQAYVDNGDVNPAARCAFWLGFTSLLNGEAAKAGGWLSRANRMLDAHPDCVEQGYLLLTTGYRLFHEGDLVTAHAAFVQAGGFGERFRDKDLVTLALQGQGRALIRQDEVERGLALLDEAMVAVTAGEVSALTAGGVYCSVLDACGEIFDLQRAHEWTTALEHWCASQPDLVPYRGHCLVRRSELLQLHGSWPGALDEAQRASEWLSRPIPKPALGAALYQVGEIQRMRGNLAEAEEAYKQASLFDSGSKPGLALLRLAQGEVEAAHAAIRHIAEDVHAIAPRARVLDAYVEIALAASDIASARASCDELAEIARRNSVPFLRALSSQASGAVLMAEGNARSALVELRQSCAIWSELQAPYECARARVLMAQAYYKLGDEESALSELAAARQTFQQLGAAVEIARIENVLPSPIFPEKSLLTNRELEVLRLVASGKTNRGIASKLGISEKTVARYVSNIFTKLDLNSRSAATAYAYAHELV